MFAQVCSAGSRLLIQESVYDDVIARIKLRMSHLRLGHCLDKTIDMGALVDEAQRRSVDEMVQSARAEGAEVLLLSSDCHHHHHRHHHHHHHVFTLHCHCLPLATSDQHLRCDVGLEEGEYSENCLCVTVLCTIIMSQDTSSSYRSVDCIRL